MLALRVPVVVFKMGFILVATERSNGFATPNAEKFRLIHALFFRFCPEA
ncbi:hypothetical protein MCP1_600014 [Candidatus Terasakiella magnetica]|nr:hypothetical protein MCP1_600014 [Candidatus Terasakiella magnetica]